MAILDVTIPYTPRPLQWTLHQALDAHRFAVAVCHRRFGKTVLAVNQLQKCAVTCAKERPRFAYIAPTYTQGKRAAWDYMKHYAAPIPGVRVHESELRIDYPNGGQVRIYGADNPDALRGIYLDGVVLDEYGLMPPNVYSEVVRPLLSDRLGWAFFIGTPNGRNQFWEQAQQAQQQEGWFFAQYKASETGLIDAKELALARQDMTQDEYDQEYECSFEASVKGAIFAREIVQAKQDNRITRVPYDPVLRVDTDWDLGVGDATAIWFSQTLYTGEVRLIDYYEASGHGLQHYVNVLTQKPYAYGQHWAPHDIQVKELGTGRSRLEAAMSLGLNFQVGPKVETLEDGIHAARMLFPRCWIDAEKCAAGIEALQNYKWDYNTRINEFKAIPVHDRWSHGADAFRGLAYRHYNPRRRPEREAALAVKRAQEDRGETFRWGNNSRFSRGGMVRMR